LTGEDEIKIVHKFGRSPDITTSFLPVSIDNDYPTPTTPVSLEFVSSNTNDALDSTGMHELTITGIGPDWREQTAVVAAHATDGLVAVAIPGTWLRVYRAYVSSSGTYATSSAGSHAGAITIRVASAGATYATISATDFPRGQTEIGAYTVPLGWTAYLADVDLSVGGSQTIDMVIYRRMNANDVTTPFSPMRALLDFDGVSGRSAYNPRVPIYIGEGPTDVGAMAKGTLNDDVSINMEFLLIPNGE
jgi:hypothetical protein